MGIVITLWIYSIHTKLTRKDQHNFPQTSTQQEFMTRHKKVYKSRLKLRKLWAPNGNIKTRLAPPATAAAAKKRTQQKVSTKRRKHDQGGNVKIYTSKSCLAKKYFTGKIEWGDNAEIRASRIRKPLAPLTNYSWLSYCKCFLSNGLL